MTGFAEPMNAAAWAFAVTTIALALLARYCMRQWQQCLDGWWKAEAEAEVQLSRCISRDMAQHTLLCDLANESAVEREAEPPGIPWVTVQIDPDTWAQLMAWKEAQR